MRSSLLALPSRLSGWSAVWLTFSLGALSAAALPPLHVLPVLLVSVPGLLTLIGRSDHAAMAFRRGWWFGFGLNLLGLYWVTEAILIEGERFWWLVPLAVPALAAVMAVFIGLATMGTRLASAGWRRILMLAGCWTAMDLARQFVLTGFPWNPLGSVWAVPGPIGDVMIQPAAWVSVHGLTLLTVLLAAAPTLGWQGWAAAGISILLWAGFGASPPSQPAQSPGARMVVAQGNVPQGQKWDRSLIDSTFDRYLRLTAEGIQRAGPGTTVVLWPETASPYQLATDAGARMAISDVIGDAIALIGAVRFGAEGRPRNSLFALASGGLITQIYDKAHLVPFGEYQPDWLAIGIQLVPGGGFMPGPGPTTLSPPGIPPVGPQICYEIIFPGQIVDEANRPAWIANVTNDAWFGNSSGPRQHLAAARMRAVEEGLPLVRAANTGISAVFDGRGHEIARLGMRETGTIVTDLPPALPPTIFARFGLALPAVMALTAIISAMIGANPWDRRVQRRSRNT